MKWDAFATAVEQGRKVGAVFGPALARWSAFAACAFALAVFVAWAAAGGPPVALMGDGRDTPITVILSFLTEHSTNAGRGVLFMAALSGTAAVGLALVLLVKAASLPSALQLGCSLAWGAASLAWFFFAEVAPPLATRVAPAAVLIGDAVGFVLYVLAALAMVGFWRDYPRRVSVEEWVQCAEHQKERDKLIQYFERRNVWLFRPRNAAAIRDWAVRVHDGSHFRKMAVFLFACAIALVPLWHVDMLEPAMTLEWRAFWAAGRGLFFGLVLAPTAYASGFVALIISRHRRLGSLDERRCVEWIRGALMINFTLCVFILAGYALMLPVMLLDLALWPESDVPVLGRQLYFGLQWSFFPAVLCAPLLFIGALAASILYRGTIDPRLVVGRFTLWGMLGLIITFIFVLVERAVALQLVVWFDLPPQTGALAAGAAVAASFQPIRRRAERWSAAALVRLMPPTALMGGTVRCGAVAVTRVMALVSPSAIDDQGPLLASALVQREAHRVAEQHGGRFVRFTADGVLMHFAVAVQALRAVQELHHAIGVGSQVLNLNQADVCTGLHWGDFVETQDGDLLGQTLLTAIRISGEANPGDIHRSPAFDLRLAAEPDQARLGAA